GLPTRRGRLIMTPSAGGQAAEDPVINSTPPGRRRRRRPAPYPAVQGTLVALAAQMEGPRQ
ncbi:MAG: hypothetical protein J2P23_13470, partial [Microlunatus sp.]|nr:hypothetical protein [Microlunatus sp.]